MENLETLGYGFARTSSGEMTPTQNAGSQKSVSEFSLFVDTPADIYQELKETHAKKAIELCGSALSGQELEGGTHRFQIDLNGVREKDGTLSRMSKISLAGSIMTVLSTIEAVTPPGRKDPDFSLSRINGLSVKLRWPEKADIGDGAIEHRATERMLDYARAFDYKPHHDIRELVFARVDRASGISLHADSSRPRSLTSYEGAVFDRQSSTVHLIENSLQKDYRRLIVIAGAVAVARACQLLPEQR